MGLDGCVGTFIFTPGTPTCCGDPLNPSFSTSPRYAPRNRKSRLSLVLFPVLLGIGYLGIRLVPTASLTLPGVVLVQGVSGAAILRAVGEEIFFRGFLGGLFLRRWGLWGGNTLQAALFLVPHLVLLSVDVHLWPILPVQFLSGWILGAVRYRSGSIIECSILHAAVNVGIGLLAG